MVKEFHARNKCISFTKRSIEKRLQDVESGQTTMQVFLEREMMNGQGIASYIKKFRNNKASFPLYDALGELHDGHLAEGKYNYTSLDSMEDEEPLRLLQELEDDSQQQDDVVLLEDQRNSREEEADVVLLEDQRNLREKETQVEDSRIVTKEQRRRDLMSSLCPNYKNSRVERYLEMRSKKAKEEVAARKKECSQAADYSV
uniref:Uncharacterized protein n=1 Tax=Leersia perrieri TaxID=77586 RepID=A0A0D9XPY2_9ORYZ